MTGRLLLLRFRAQCQMFLLLPSLLPSFRPPNSGMPRTASRCCMLEAGNFFLNADLQLDFTLQRSVTSSDSQNGLKLSFIRWPRLSYLEKCSGLPWKVTLPAAHISVPIIALKEISLFSLAMEWTGLESVLVGFVDVGGLVARHSLFFFLSLHCVSRSYLFECHHY